MNNKYFKYMCFGFFVAASTTGTAQVVSKKTGNNPIMISSSAVLDGESTNKIEFIVTTQFEINFIKDKNNYIFET